MKFHRPEEEDYSLSMTSLIDVVFLLLIFFMVSTAFIDFTRQVDIELPETNAGAPPDKVSLFEMELTRDGTLFVNGDETDIDQLALLLKPTGETKQKRSAVVRADKRLDFGLVVKVMGIAREAGIYDIGVAVK